MVTGRGAGPTKFEAERLITEHLGAFDTFQQSAFCGSTPKQRRFTCSRVPVCRVGASRSETAATESEPWHSLRENGRDPLEHDPPFHFL